MLAWVGIGVLLTRGGLIMAESADIDFWLSMGSTYTYLAVMRVPKVQQETGATFRWRPFNLGVQHQEMNYMPLA